MVGILTLEQVHMKPDMTSVPDLQQGLIPKY